MTQNTLSDEIERNVMKDIIFRAKRIDNNQFVSGHYFQTPLTDENSGLPSDKGWFFLSDGEIRHCIEQNHVCYVIDINTLETI